MSALATTPAYTALLARIPPRVIRTEEQNEFFTAALYELDQRSECLTPEEEELASLLALLIQNYEEQGEQLPEATAVEMVHFLMDQHGLTLEGLQREANLASVGAVLHGTRELTTAEIRALCMRFHVSPEVFF